MRSAICERRAGVSRPMRSALVLIAVLSTVLVPGAVHASCPGDCDWDGMVTIDELITLVDIGLNGGGVERCAAGDLNGDGAITIEELVAAVAAALSGCPATATPSAIGTHTSASSPTATPPASPTVTAS